MVRYFSVFQIFFIVVLDIFLLTSSSPLPSESSALSISSLCLRSPMMELSPSLQQHGVKCHVKTGIALVSQPKLKVLKVENDVIYCKVACRYTQTDTSNVLQ